MLGQMLRRTLSKHQVSESGDFVTAFLMFWSDVALVVDQHCPFSWSAIEFESKWFSSLFCQQKMACIFGRLHIFPYGGSTPSSKWSLCEGFHPQMAHVTANVRIATHAGGGWLVKTWRNCKGEAFLCEDACSTISPLCPITQLWQFVRFSCLQGLNESCIGRFAFAHSMWCDTWKQRRRVRMRSTSCKRMLLGQMELGILSTNPVSESRNVVAAAFLMFWSDVDVMDQHHLFAGKRLNLSRSHSHTKITYMQGFLFSHTVAPSSFFLPGSKWGRCAELQTKMVNIIELHGSCSKLSRRM